MKKFFLLSLLASATVSCALEESVSFNERELVNFRVGISTPRTRVTDLSGFSEYKVNSFQVFVFSKGGEGLEKSVYVTDSSYVEMSCFSGVKEVVVIANAPEIDWLTIDTVDDLNGGTTHLGDNDPAGFFMYGSTEADVAANEFVEIEVTRRVSRVVLKSVTNEVTPNSSVGELYLNAVYLINVAGDAKYDGAEGYVSKNWYNQSDLDKDVDLTSAPYDFLYDVIDDFEGNPFGKFEVYDTMHTFYCYPNLSSVYGSDEYDGELPDSGDVNDGDVWTPAATRLVVEAKLNDRTWYYPITIKDVRSNCSYEVNLTIAGAGADSPDSDPQIENYKFSVSVAGWEVETLDELI